MLLDSAPPVPPPKARHAHVEESGVFFRIVTGWFLLGHQQEARIRLAVAIFCRVRSACQLARESLGDLHAHLSSPCLATFKTISTVIQWSLISWVQREGPAP